jgi:hypothetical protein
MKGSLAKVPNNRGGDLMAGTGTEMSHSARESNHPPPTTGTEAWENEGGATQAHGSSQTPLSKATNGEIAMSDNLRIPAAILASAMLDSGRARTHDELMKHYREFLKRLADFEASGIHQSRREGSSA